MTALNLDRIADVSHPKTYLVRHDNGECFEAECADDCTGAEAD